MPPRGKPSRVSPRSTTARDSAARAHDSPHVGRSHCRPRVRRIRRFGRSRPNDGDQIEVGDRVDIDQRSPSEGAEQGRCLQRAFPPAQRRQAVRPRSRRSRRHRAVVPEAHEPHRSDGDGRRQPPGRDHRLQRRGKPRVEQTDPRRRRDRPVCRRARNACSRRRHVTAQHVQADAPVVARPAPTAPARRGGALASPVTAPLRARLEGVDGAARRREAHRRGFPGRRVPPSGTCSRSRVKALD